MTGACGKRVLGPLNAGVRFVPPKSIGRKMPIGSDRADLPVMAFFVRGENPENLYYVVGAEQRMAQSRLQKIRCSLPRKISSVACSEDAARERSSRSAGWPMGWRRWD